MNSVRNFFLCLVIQTLFSKVIVRYKVIQRDRGFISHYGHFGRFVWVCVALWRTLREVELSEILANKFLKHRQREAVDCVAMINSNRMFLDNPGSLISHMHLLDVVALV